MTTQPVTSDLVSEQNYKQLFSQAPAPIAIYKGRELRYVFVNDAYTKIFNGRDIIGKTLREAFPELEGQGYYEILETVYDTGTPFYANDTPALIDINNNGVLKNCYYNLVYTPFKNEAGGIEGVMAFGHDVTDQVIARQKTEESREELQMAIDIAALGTFVVDLKTNIGICNPRIMEWFGFKEAKMNMDAIFAAIHPDDQLRVKNAIQQTSKFEKDNQHDIMYRVPDPDGGPDMHLRSIGKTFFEKGKAYQIKGIIQDVTAQVQYQHKIEQSEAELQRRIAERTLALESSNKELMRSNENLEAFAHAASHDLKEPIRKINFFIDRLKSQLSDRLKEEDRQTFARIENASQRMGALIDDLLLYSHVSQLPHEKEMVDLNEKVKKVLEDLELDIEQKQAQISVAHLPVIKGYRRQLQQLFQNLIGNALKYSKPGVAPVIGITCGTVTGQEIGYTSDGEASQPYHLIEVKDNGIGFEQKEAERIFQMFQRLHGNTEYRGTGVGLSIVRKVVENHNGKVIAESKPGAGAIFKVYLPVIEL